MMKFLDFPLVGLDSQKKARRMRGAWMIRKRERVMEERERERERGGGGARGG